MLAERPPEKRVEALASTLLGLVYVALLLQFLVRIVTPLPGDAVLPDGRLILCLWVVAVAKFCDAGRAPDRAGRRPPPAGPEHQPEEDLGGRGRRGRWPRWVVGALVAWLGRGDLAPVPFAPLRRP